MVVFDTPKQHRANDLFFFVIYSLIMSLFLAYLLFSLNMIVHWQAKDFPARDVLHQLVCLNDRFALDGLSPPSYFGLLWCAGFQDKPSTSGGQQLISTKWASQYRQGATGFEVAMTKLYDCPSDCDGRNENGCLSSIEQTTTTASGPPMAKKMRRDDSNGGIKSKSIMSYFSPVNQGELDGATKTIG
jgi:hypothetical protein